MSYIAFNTRRGRDVLIRGPERYLMSGMVSDFMRIATKHVSPKLVAAAGNPEHYVTAQAYRVAAATDATRYAEKKRFDQQLETYLRVAGDHDEPLFRGADLFVMALNSALMLGSPLVRFCARVHGQCEIHLWWEESEHAGIADLIDQGLAANVLRAEMGWPAAATLLREPDIGEVVLSYSVTESFPDSYSAIDERLPPAADFTGYASKPEDEKRRLSDLADDRDEIWTGFTDEERWAAGMRSLREKGDGMKLTIASLCGPYGVTGSEGGFAFGDGRTGFDLGRATAQAVKL